MVAETLVDTLTDLSRGDGGETGQHAGQCRRGDTCSCSGRHATRVEPETLRKTLPDVMPEALLHALADTGPEIAAETLYEPLSDMKARTLVKALDDTQPKF